MQGLIHLLVLTFSLLVAFNTSSTFTDLSDNVRLNCSAEEIVVQVTTREMTTVYSLTLKCSYSDAQGTLVTEPTINVLEDHRAQNQIRHVNSPTDSGGGYTAKTTLLHLNLKEGSQCVTKGMYGKYNNPRSGLDELPSQYCTIPELQLIPPVVPGSVVRITEGEDLNVTCRNSNPERLVVSQVWVDSERIDLSTLATLTVENITRNYSGVYTCVFTDVRNRSVEANTTVEVQYVPEVTILQPSTLSPLLIREDLFLSCEYDGVPSPNITWLHNGTELESLTGKVLITIMDGLSNLTVTNFSGDDVGEYTCEAFNGVGKDSNIITVDIKYPTTVTPSQSIYYNTIPMTSIGVVLVLLLTLSIFIIVAYTRRKSGKYSKYHFPNNIDDSIDLDFEPVLVEKHRSISVSMETVLCSTHPGPAVSTKFKFVSENIAAHSSQRTTKESMPHNSATCTEQHNAGHDKKNLENNYSVEQENNVMVITSTVGECESKLGGYQSLQGDDCVGHTVEDCTISNSLESTQVNQQQITSEIGNENHIMVETEQNKYSCLTWQSTHLTAEGEQQIPESCYLKANPPSTIGYISIIEGHHNSLFGAEEEPTTTINELLEEANSSDQLDCDPNYINEDVTSSGSVATSSDPATKSVEDNNSELSVISSKKDSLYGDTMTHSSIPLMLSDNDIVGTLISIEQESLNQSHIDDRGMDSKLFGGLPIPLKTSYLSCDNEGIYPLEVATTL